MVGSDVTQKWRIAHSIGGRGNFRIMVYYVCFYNDIYGLYNSLDNVCFHCEHRFYSSFSPSPPNNVASPSEASSLEDTNTCR